MATEAREGLLALLAVHSREVAAVQATDERAFVAVHAVDDRMLVAVHAIDERVLVAATVHADERRLARTRASARTRVGAHLPGGRGFLHPQVRRPRRPL